MDQNLFNYNDEDIDSVIEYSHKLLNRKFSDVMEEYNRSLYKSYDDYNPKSFIPLSTRCNLQNP